MILIDYSQVLISNLMAQIKYNPLGQVTALTGVSGQDLTLKVDAINEDLIRHMVLDSILRMKKKFGPDYGELIFCCDDKEYWRKKVFTYYKANRKKAREASGLDWPLIFSTLNKLRDELRDNFPYRVIQVRGAEADDIIATVCEEYGTTSDFFSHSKEKILIVSGDGDFLQLQKYENVQQYSPILKRFLVEKNPKKYLMEHIIRGDSGDGIPNFLTQDDVFVTDGISQKKIMSKKVVEWLKCDKPEDFCDDKMLRYFKRNEQLIDLSFVPTDVKERIKEALKQEPVGKGKRLIPYFVKHKLKILFDSVGEF